MRVQSISWAFLTRNALRKIRGRSSWFMIRTFRNGWMDFYFCNFAEFHRLNFQRCPVRWFPPEFSDCSMPYFGWRCEGKEWECLQFFRATTMEGFIDWYSRCCREMSQVIFSLLAALIRNQPLQVCLLLFLLLSIQFIAADRKIMMWPLLLVAGPALSLSWPDGSDRTLVSAPHNWWYMKPVCSTSMVMMMERSGPKAARVPKTNPRIWSGPTWPPFSARSSYHQSKTKVSGIHAHERKWYARGAPVIVM